MGLRTIPRKPGGHGESMKATYRLGAAGVLLVLVLGATLAVTFGASAQSNLPRRAIIAVAAADGTPEPAPTVILPPPDASYCAGSQGPSVPPNAVFGTVSIGGAPAPQDTIVQVFFDGKAGPADAATRGSSSSGYGIDYAAGSAASCSNKVGAAIQVVVAGRLFDTGLKVGDEAANPVFRYDVVVP